MAHDNAFTTLTLAYGAYALTVCMCLNAPCACRGKVEGGVFCKQAEEDCRLVEIQIHI